MYEFELVDENGMEIEVSPREALGETSGNQRLNPGQPFSWDKQTTQLLVERYMHLKDAFRDPKIKKKKLWDEIKQTFTSKGHNVTEEILDRKWRNMKKTYTGIKDNIRKTGRGRIHWEYYNQFDEIYRDDKTVNLPRTLSSAPVSVIQKGPGINPDSIKEPVQIIEEPQPSIAATPQIEKQKDNITLTPKSTKMDSKSGMFYLRKKLAEIETARVNEIKLLREALERHNEIQERRNEILENFFNSSKKQ
ncbi:trihelix transcription factor GTL1-like isoform X2 [Coccinella septempunctata]|uniref:trihelix transcription factor GTL1-like isoform X2 n=1 Tax=Coccinella septempunctata TaxID=41139 RepID=UPI001D065924|nr:trihelix transcription factor GTL1-like isoform X2 [Coccinella septempunctata]XP_044751453.1 trihelix transcription factor GTL1-like isoform X2 [Coccinella septempunctata]XP_044766810.1 trihelix transcription factor GTL1-like isoform X2 [Coccinella septempunctata]